MINRPPSDPSATDAPESETTGPDPADADTAPDAATEETSDAEAEAKPGSKELAKRDSQELAKPGTREQATVLRELLSQRREAEHFRGEASRLREDAASEAERMVRQAEELATQLVEEARTEADLMGQAARTHAEALTAGAEEEALRLRKEVTDEVAATRLRAEAAQRVQLEEGRRLIREAVQEAASSVGDLRTRLGAALESITAVESRLIDLTDAEEIDIASHPSSKQVVLPPMAAQPVPKDSVEAGSGPSRSGPVVIETKPTKGGSKPSRTRAPASANGASTDAGAQNGTHETGEEGRPLGWLFRASQR